MPSIIHGSTGGNCKVVENRGLISRYEVFTYSRGTTTTFDLSDWNVDNIICKQYYDLPYSYQESVKLDRTNKTLTITNSQSTSSTKNKITIVEWNCIKWQTVGASFDHSTTKTVTATPEATRRIVLTTQASETNGYVGSVSGETALASIRGGITIYSPLDTIVNLSGGGYYGDCNAYGIILDL